MSIAPNLPRIRTREQGPTELDTWGINCLVYTIYYGWGESFGGKEEKMIMRPIWSGSISFGLVFIPVRLYSATENTDINFDLLHKKDLSPIRYAKVCTHDGVEISHEDIVKGYEYEEGRYVVIDEKEFEQARAKKTKTISILSFADIDEVDSVYFEKPYYLEPDKGSDKVYALLRDALATSGKVGIAKFVLRNREHLAVIKAQNGVLILNQLRFAEEIRNSEQLNLPDAKPTKPELEMALALINQLTEPFTIDDYHDTYTTQLEEMIEEKVEGHPLPKEKEPAPVSAEVKDIMSLLKASLAKDSKNRTQAEEPAKPGKSRRHRRSA